jgi:hypothetical protein
MALHKFKVGEFVDFAPSRPGVTTPGSQYEIVRLLPADGTVHRYRVKPKSEAFERVANESDVVTGAQKNAASRLF